MLKRNFLLLFLLVAIHTTGFTQEPGHVYFELSGNAFFFEESDAIFGGTGIANVKVSQKIALGIGASATRFKGADNTYVPCFGNISYFISDKKKIMLIAEAQLGYAPYTNESFSSYTSLSFRFRTAGKFYASPGIGCYFKLDNFQPFFKIAYVNASFKNEATTTTFRSGQVPEKITKTTSTEMLNGVIISIGVKLF